MKDTDPFSHDESLRNYKILILWTAIFGVFMLHAHRNLRC